MRHRCLEVFSRAAVTWGTIPRNVDCGEPIRQEPSKPTQQHLLPGARSERVECPLRTRKRPTSFEGSVQKVNRNRDFLPRSSFRLIPQTRPKSLTTRELAGSSDLSGIGGLLAEALCQ